MKLLQRLRAPEPYAPWPQAFTLDALLRAWMVVLVQPGLATGFAATSRAPSRAALLTMIWL